MSQCPSCGGDCGRPGGACGYVSGLLPETKPALTPKAAMKLAKQAYAYTSSDGKTAPSITMTAGNLVRFFELASKEYKP